MKEVSQLLNTIGYDFNDRDLLKNALTHSSYSSEHRLDYSSNNERLEFIGDAYVDAAIGAELFRIMKRRSAFYLKALEDGFMGTYIDSSMKLLIIEFFGANADSITDEDIFKLRYIVSGCLMTIFEWMAGKIDASEEELAEKICTTMDKLYRAKI